jgi:RNA recognition motif-containing protein
VSKVFVGNLSFDTTKEELEALFAPIGDVSEVFVPTDRSTGRPRGFAFVTFANSESAAQAIQKLDGASLGGRNLRVNEATEQRPSGGGGGGFGRPFGGGSGGGGGFDRPGPPPRAKGSRRNVRARKRGMF